MTDPSGYMGAVQPGQSNPDPYQDWNPFSWMTWDSGDATDTDWLDDGAEMAKDAWQPFLWCVADGLGIPRSLVLGLPALRVFKPGGPGGGGKWVIEFSLKNWEKFLDRIIPGAADKKFAGQCFWAFIDWTLIDCLIKEGKTYKG